MKPMLLSLYKSEWIYRGEGNKNLVISLPEKKLILRMQKCKTASPIAKHENKLIRDVQFFKVIMAPLIGKAFVEPPFLIRVTENDVSELNDFLYHQRPSSRLNKKLFYTLITGQPDYTFMIPKNWMKNWEKGLQLSDQNPTFCFEIKPKQGWLPSIDRRSKCTFCTNQYLKLKRKQVKSISEYCPQDLFSGNSYRMKRALKSLLKTPQNNLKIFKDGNLVYGEECSVDYIEIIQEVMEQNSNDQESLIENWAALLHKAITKDLRDGSPKDFKYENKENFEISAHSCDWNKEPLPKNCVLQRILTAQKLQNTSFEDIYALYCERKKLECDYDYVDNLIKNKEFGDIERYLISATAKDCSLFIALQKTSTRNMDCKSVIEMNGVSYRISIGVGDLDPKPLSCIEKQRKRDSESLSAMLSHEFNQKLRS